MPVRARRTYTRTAKKYIGRSGRPRIVYSSGGKHYVRGSRLGSDGKRHAYYRRVRLGNCVDGVCKPRRRKTRRRRTRR